MFRPLRVPDVLVPIGQVSRASGLTRRAIRFYEEQGLVETRRDAAGRRLYDRTAFERIVFIGQARQAGLPLGEIGALLEIGGGDGRERLEATADCYRARLADLEAQRGAIEASALALGISLERQRPVLVAG